MTIRQLFELQVGDRVKVSIFGGDPFETGSVAGIHEDGVTVEWDRENHSTPQSPSSRFEVREFQNETPLRNIANLERS